MLPGQPELSPQEFGTRSGLPTTPKLSLESAFIVTLIQSNESTCSETVSRALSIGPRQLDPKILSGVSGHFSSNSKPGGRLGASRQPVVKKIGKAERPRLNGFFSKSIFPIDQGSGQVYVSGYVSLSADQNRSNPTLRFKSGSVLAVSCL